MTVSIDIPRRGIGALCHVGLTLSSSVSHGADRRGAGFARQCIPRVLAGFFFSGCRTDHVVGVDTMVSSSVRAFAIR